MTNRVLSGYKAAQTRQLHKLQEVLWGRFRASCLREAKFIPSLCQHEGQWELTYDRGYGIRSLKFSSRNDAYDWIGSLC